MEDKNNNDNKNSSTLRAQAKLLALSDISETFSENHSQHHLIRRVVTSTKLMNDKSINYLNRELGL